MEGAKMFDFPNLTGLNHIEVLKLRDDAKQYWTFLKHLLGLWTGFGDRAEKLVSVYKWSKGQRKMVEELTAALDWHDIKVVNIAGEMSRVDDYLKQIAIVLGEEVLDTVHSFVEPPSDITPEELP
jgi:hypothetical protein